MNFKNLITGCIITMLCSIASAVQNVTVHWPYGIGDPTVTILRAILDKANQLQIQYNFIIVAVPGAGGAIAANKTLANKELTLLATSSTFFIRPMLFSDSNYNFDDFKPSLVMFSAPFALLAKQDFDETRLRKNSSLSLGIAGLGSTTHIIGEKIKESYPNLLIVPYKSLVDSLADLKGGQIDLSLDLIRHAEAQYDTKILGITGNKKIKNYKLLNNLGIADIELAGSDVFIVRPRTMNAAVSIQLDSILLQASSDNQTLDKLYKEDSAIPYLFQTQSQKDEWYRLQIQSMKYLTKNINLN